MNWQTFFSNFNLQSLLDAIIVGGAIIYGISQWKNGNTTSKSVDAQTANDTIDLLTKRADTFSVELKEEQRKRQLDHDDIVRLQEQIKHKDAQIEQLKEILQGRNPEMEAFMKLVTDATVATAMYQKTTAGMLGEIQNWMVDLDKKLEKKIEVKVV